MSAASASRFVVAPGRREEFIGVIRQIKGVMGPLGGTTTLRQVQYGGETAGQLSLVTMFESERARAEALDKSRAENLLAGVAATMQGANPPAQLLSRVLLSEVGGPEGLPMPKPVLTSAAWSVAPGHFDEAMAAFEAARAKHAGLGVEARLFRVASGGALNGALIRGMSFDSLAAQQTFADANAAAPGTPIGTAVRAGTITSVGASLQFSIDV